MKVLIVEDEGTKFDDISSFIKNYMETADVDIFHAETFSHATTLIYEKQFDLIVVDLLMPRRIGDEPSDISEELLDHLRESHLNSGATVVAISQFSDVVSVRRAGFTQLGGFVIEYNDIESWKACLGILLQKIESEQQVDFVVICALDKEIEAFSEVSIESYVAPHDPFTKIGLDCKRMAIGSLKGVCIRLPRMGLVDSSAVASRALVCFRPKLICMSGICAGFKSNVNLGQLLVTETCWDYQSGKWSGDEFRPAAYHEPVKNQTMVILRHVAAQIEADGNYLKDLRSIKPNAIPVIFAPSVSGSAVIASESKISQLSDQHRKIAGLDMEVYGIHRSAALHHKDVLVFSAKTVVDLGDENKNDGLQEEGCIFAARFTTLGIKALLA